jgi:hypothetical protein
MPAPLACQRNGSLGLLVEPVAGLDGDRLMPEQLPTDPPPPGIVDVGRHTTKVTPYRPGFVTHDLSSVLFQVHQGFMHDIIVSPKRHVGR